MKTSAFVLPWLLLACANALEAGSRVTLSLDGVWQVQDSVAGDAIPDTWHHTVPVPGLANLAEPVFPDVDRYDSRELIDNRIRAGHLSEAARIAAGGVSRQQRNYFWYRRTFRASPARQVAILKIAKAQFGIVAWVNRRRVGEHLSCFTAAYFEISRAIRWDGDNEIIIRVGAHPGVLPSSVPTGTDLEKLKWTPGIYDRVSLFLSDNPVVETVQVAPRLRPAGVLVEAVVRNFGPATTFRLAHAVREWRTGREVARSAGREVRLGAGAWVTVREEIQLPGARLWSPEDPFLYVVTSRTSGDSVDTRFGVREFRFDTATKRAYLNGQPYFLRGTNITLHRFFEDPLCGGLPWDPGWVRRLLGEIPKRLHWNAMRFAIGPVPGFWFDIADEVGLLIQNEFPIWTGEPGEIRSERWKEWSAEVLEAQFREYMRDHWNHPSQAIWDAANETDSPMLRDRIVPAVRTLDLSNRPWDNGYNFPSAPDDPVEDHPYLFFRVYEGGDFRMAELEQMTGAKSSYRPHPTAHAALLNEYGWLWLTRDGTPTQLTRRVYDGLLGPSASPRERLELNGYLLAGLTEFWRAHRNFAGVLHFVYLTGSYEGAYTSDAFRDVQRLELHPTFESWVGEAFRPLGVYINYWQEAIGRGASREYAVMMINDHPQPVSGTLVLAFVTEEGAEMTRVSTPFQLAATGAHTYGLTLPAPAAPGRYLLRATAQPEGAPGSGPTRSRRKVRVD